MLLPLRPATLYEFRHGYISCLRNCMINWPVLIPAIAIIILLLVLIIIRNRKDREDLEEKLNEDYKKPVEGEVDLETGDDGRI
jgi:hypothetical protein